MCAILLVYTIIAGLLISVPPLSILHETIRNLFFHVPMWFTMMLLFVIGFGYSIKYLVSGRLKDDIYSVQFISVGLIFGCLGMATGMEWANFTWGQPWSNDPKQLGAALSMLVYFAYFALRGAIPDIEKKAKIAAVYSIFSFALMIPFIWILPSLKGVGSLHPGNGGNVGFSTYDIDDNLMKVFYPAVVGWFLLGLWITSLFIRLRLLDNRDILQEIENERAVEKSVSEKDLLIYE